MLRPQPIKRTKHLQDHVKVDGSCKINLTIRDISFAHFMSEFIFGEEILIQMPVDVLDLIQTTQLTVKIKE